MTSREDDDLEAELLALGEALDVPPPPDTMAAAVRARLETPVRQRLKKWKVVAAVVVVVIALTAATPQGRAAVRQILRYAGIELSFGEHTKPPATQQPIPGERSTGLAEARKQAKFTIKVPAELGEPTKVTVSDRGRVVSLLYPGGVRLDEYDGVLSLVFRKELGPPWPEETTVNTAQAWWIPAKHGLSYLPGNGSTVPLRLAGMTLFWQDSGTGMRLEGVQDMQTAVRIAASAR